MPPRNTTAASTAAPELDLKAAAKACFDANPDVQEFYQTTDGQCFAQQADAKRHAKSLDADDVERVTRDEAPADTPAA